MARVKRVREARNPLRLKTEDELWVGVKGQSNPDSCLLKCI